jgi:hypothetical protein
MVGACVHFLGLLAVVELYCIVALYPAIQLAKSNRIRAAFEEYLHLVGLGWGSE